MLNENKTGPALLGEKFPEMHAQTTMGPINLPIDSEGKWMVLFSHPADFTPVCTTEFVAFARRYKDFANINTMLVGLSVDQVFSHIKWVEWIKTTLHVDILFPIIADDLGHASQRLGLIHPGKGNNPVRAVFIVDPHGIIRLIMYYPQEIGRQTDEILRALKALQAADKHKVALPENWPANELIGAKAINLPPKDIDTANSRLAQNEGFDWWFTTKEIE
ncbi:MAG: peroxiredoxin [Ignavibacteria bacterium]|nr:peroxiredoxin [Ignavibacteria bacterium]